MRREKLKEYEILSKRLFELRTSYNYTQLDVAAKLAITYQSYQAYELGVSVPSLQNIIKLADLYEVSIDFLLGRSDL